MKRAFSLMEMLVVLGLSFLGLVLMAELFLPSLWLYQKEQAMSEVHQSALLIRQKLEHELVNSCLETMTVAYQADGNWYLAWAEVEDYNPVTRGPSYNSKGLFNLACYQAQKSLFQYGHGSHTGVPPATFQASSPKAPRLTEPQLLDIFLKRPGGALAYPLRTLARNVEKFSFYDQNGDTNFDIFYPPLGFRLTTKAQILGSRPHVERSELECKLTPRVRRW